MPGVAHSGQGSHITAMHNCLQAYAAEEQQQEASFGRPHDTLLAAWRAHSTAPGPADRAESIWGHGASLIMWMCFFMLHTELLQQAHRSVMSVQSEWGVVFCVEVFVTKEENFMNNFVLPRMLKP